MPNKQTVITPFGERLAENVHVVPAGGRVVHVDDGIHLEDATGKVVHVAKNTVLTPFGERPSTKVHAVPEGGQVLHVNDEIHLVDEAGKVVHVAKNDGTKVRRTPIGERTVAEKSGWVAYAYWTNNESSPPIKSFTTTWDVPDIPGRDDDQTLFLFNSIEPLSYNAILQPVLQYGPSAAGGGPSWTVASWYLVGNETYHTSLASVSVGDSLNGEITLTGKTDSGYNYSCSFSNVNGTSLTAKDAEQLVWATETLESYNVTSSDDYPIGSTVFYSVNINLSDGSIPSVAWTPVSDSDDGLFTTVNVDGASGGKITIKYPTSS